MSLSCLLTTPLPSLTPRVLCGCAGKLFAEVKPDDCFWTVEDKRSVVVTLSKASTMQWWSRIVEGDPEINTRKVEPVYSKLGDLDGDTRLFKVSVALYMTRTHLRALTQCLHTV